MYSCCCGSCFSNVHRPWSVWRTRTAPRSIRGTRQESRAGDETAILQPLPKGWASSLLSSFRQVSGCRRMIPRSVVTNRPPSPASQRLIGFAALSGNGTTENDCPLFSLSNSSPAPAVSTIRPSRKVVPPCRRAFVRVSIFCQTAPSSLRKIFPRNPNTTAPRLANGKAPKKFPHITRPAAPTLGQGLCCATPYQTRRSARAPVAGTRDLVKMRVVVLNHFRPLFTIAR